MSECRMYLLSTSTPMLRAACEVQGARRYANYTYFNNPTGAVAALQAYLQGYNAAYQRNVWLTEWAMIDFGNSTNNYAWTFPSYPQQVAFLQAAVPMLESLSFVERYAWFYL